jgi:tetratricopeptide (TPR) repeat protein
MNRLVLAPSLAAVVSFAALALATGCSRNNIEAVNLSNEGDKVKATNPDEAISKYEQAANLDPDNIRILWRLVQMYSKKEQWQKVVETCTKAQGKMKEGKKHANFYLHQGIAIARMAATGKGSSWSEAKQPLEEAIKIDPNLADAYFELAEAQLNLDDENGALANYTKAIQAKPDEAQYYGPLAELYVRLNMLEQAEQTLNAGLSFVKEGNKHLFQLHSLLGDIQEKKGNLSGAITSYETAKRACGQCNEPGQPIAYFNLGAAYARANPPRKTEAINNLANFQKIVCKGAAAARYASQCSQAQQIVTSVGGNGP